MSDLERFFAKVGHAERCWLWNGACNPQGYALFWSEGKVKAAHRVAYEWFIGAIPKGLQLDHLCRVRHCVNPVHLEPVSNRENALRGEAPNIQRRREGVCKYGHSLADAYRDSRGRVRNCRTCKLAKRASGEWSRGRVIPRGGR